MGIKIEHVSYSYGNHLILEDINASFPDVGFCVIIGKSGSGKTTFLSLLSHVLKVEKGKITGNERENIAEVFQSPLLLPYLTVEENVLFPLHFQKENHHNIDEVLKSVQLEDKKESDVTKLSGGEKMRVSLARALIQQKDILILDEPTGQLDEKTSFEIYGILKEISKSKLVLMVTHDEKNSFSFADCIYELKDKKLFLLQERNLNTTLKKEKIESKTISLKDALHLEKRFLSSKRKRTLIASLFLAFHLTLVYFGWAIKDRSYPFLDSLAEEYYASDTYTIKEKKKIAEEGHLTLEQYIIPEKEKIKTMGIEEIYPSLDYFLPASFSISFHQKDEVISFQPVLEQEEKRLYQGRLMKEGEAIVNRSFLKQFSLDESVIGEFFSFTYQTILKCDESEDLISFRYSFKIVGISKEKEVLNQPVVYYEYFSVFDLVSNFYLENHSRKLEKDVYLSDYLNPEIYSEEDFLSHQVLALIKDTSKIKQVDNITITNHASSVKESAKEVLDALLKVVLLFLFLNLLGSFLSEFLTIYSLYEDNIRLFSLLTLFPFYTRNKRKFILAKTLLFSFYSALFLSLFIISFTLIIDQLLLSFSYPKLFSGISIFKVIVEFLLIIFFSYLASYFALKRIKEEEVKKELEGED